MSFTVEPHVLDRIATAPILRDPFPHIVVDDVFPEDFYEDIVDQWPAEGSWRPLSETARVTNGGYAERMVVRFGGNDVRRLDVRRQQFWIDRVWSWMSGPTFRSALLAKFGEELSASGHGVSPENSIADALIVSDRNGYSIGPHTDAPHRVVSLLYYLPEDATFRRFGTCLYVPADGKFRCKGGPHHGFAGFLRAKTVDFLPNRLLAFPKSDRCFHGVEPVDLPGIDRRLLIYDLRRRAQLS